MTHDAAHIIVWRTHQCSLPTTALLLYERREDRVWIKSLLSSKATHTVNRECDCLLVGYLLNVPATG